MSFLRAITRSEYFSVIRNVFLVAVAIRLLVLGALVYFHGYSAILLGDSTHYLILAEHVQQGIGYVYDGVLEAYRAPGYPAFLYIFVSTGVPLIVGSFIQIIVASLIPATSYMIMRRLGVTHTYSFVGALFLAVEPVMVFYSIVLMPDVFFSVATLIAAWLAVKWTSEYPMSVAMYAGIAIGVSNYFRPANLYLPIGLFIAGFLLLLIRRHLSARSVLSLVLIPFFAFLITVPWSLRNLHQFGTMEFVSSQAPNLYKYGAGATLATAENRDFAPVVQELYAKAAAEMPDPDINAFANKTYLVKRSKEIILAHPAAYLESYLLGLSGFWFSGNYHSLLGKYGVISAEHRSVSYSLVLGREGVTGLIRTIVRTFDSYVVIALGGKALWLLIGGATVAGLWITRRRPEAWVTALLIAYFSATLLSTTIGVEARHRYALNPLMIAFTAVACSALHRRLFGRRNT